jgi:hypothetical protein
VNSFAGFQNRIKMSSESADASAAMMSVRYGPMKFETRNCANAKVRPQSAAAGHTATAPLHPAISTTRYIGMTRAISGDSRPTAALSDISGSPVTPAKVTIGVASAPNATGAVFATRHRAAAVNAGSPSPTSNDADTATGVPKPDVPSMNAPKLNAMSKTSSR